MKDLMNTFRRRLKDRNEQGAVAVEFAFVLPILLMLIFGAIEYGRVFSQVEVFESAAREGARAAAVRAPDGVSAAIVDAASPYSVDLSSLSVSNVCTPDTVGQSVTVSWVQDFEINIALLPSWTNTKMIQGTFRCE